MTWWEATTTVILATLVCVIAALMFNINFYQDFWVFWFCFVVGTAHFSLVKVPPYSVLLTIIFNSTKQMAPFPYPIL